MSNVNKVSVNQSADEALSRLREGNQRFVDGQRLIDTYLSHTNFNDHVDGQSPFAVVLGCSDSRVPVEIVFDAGLGDLFVIRVAGNIVAPSLIGSVEFAAAKFGTRLVVVLGHSGCGAVDATLSSVQDPEDTGLQHIHEIVEHIRPSVQSALEDSTTSDRDTLIASAVRRNVRASADQLRHGSDTLEKLIHTDGLRIVGAEYSLATGEVDFFDGV